MDCVELLIGLFSEKFIAKSEGDVMQRIVSRRGWGYCQNKEEEDVAGGRRRTEYTEK